MSVEWDVGRQVGCSAQWVVREEERNKIETILWSVRTGYRLPDFAIIRVPGNSQGTIPKRVPTMRPSSLLSHLAHSPLPLGFRYPL